MPPTLYTAAKALVTSSLSGTPPSFHCHWLRLSWSLEPPPVKMLIGDGSRTKAREVAPPRPLDVQPAPAAQVNNVCQSSAGVGDWLNGITFPSISKTPSLPTSASAGPAVSASAARATRHRAALSSAVGMVIGHLL